MLLLLPVLYILMCGTVSARQATTITLALPSSLYTNTRVIQPNDPTNDHPTIFEFPQGSPEGSQDKSQADKKEFIWDIYKYPGACTSFEGGYACERLYRLHCHIEVDKTFTGNAEFALGLRSPYVALVSEDSTAKEAVSIVCSKSQGQCAVAGSGGEAEKNLCEQMPGWDDGGY